MLLLDVETQSTESNCIFDCMAINFLSDGVYSLQKLHSPLFRARPDPPFGARPFERRGFLSLAVFANALYVEAQADW